MVNVISRLNFVVWRIINGLQTTIWTAFALTPFNPYAAGTEYTRFQANFRPINSTRIAKMFCDRCLVNLILTFWRCIFVHKNNNFSSFGAGNCVSNSSFKWIKNSLEKIGSIKVKPSALNEWTILTNNSDAQGSDVEMPCVSGGIFKLHHYIDQYLISSFGHVYPK